MTEDDEQAIDADEAEPDTSDDDGAAEDAAAEDAEERPARRRGLDGRTLAICALVAVIAALLAGFATSRLTADDDDPDGRGILTAAETVPDLALPRFDGSELRTTDFRGQPLVINFWASWCTPCIDEMPAFQEVHESLGDSVAFLGVNSRDSVDTAEQMIETTGVTYELARDVDGALARALDVASLPVTVLVLPDGTIVETLQREVSGARLCEAINQSLLNQSLGEGDCG